MASKNHQFMSFGDKVVKKYIRTRNQAVTGYRQDPYRPENQLDFLLISPDSDFDVQWIDGEEVKVIRKAFDYNNEVLELYSDIEVAMFLRWNKKLLENGLLREYSGNAPALDLSNVLDDDAIKAIAMIKTLPALKKRLQQITSVHTLKSIYQVVETLDRPMSIAKAVQDRIKEL